MDRGYYNETSSKTGNPSGERIVMRSQQTPPILETFRSNTCLAVRDNLQWITYVWNVASRVCFQISLEGTRWSLQQINYVNELVSIQNNDEEEAMEVAFELGRMYLKNDCAYNPLKCKYSHFAIPISDLAPSFFIIEPGCCGLQLFQGDDLIGILCGCVKDNREFLVFLNVRYIASKTPTKWNTEIFGVDLGSLPLDNLENWKAENADLFMYLGSEMWCGQYTDSAKFAKSVSGVAPALPQNPSDPSSLVFKVAFLIYLCYWLHCHRNRLQRKPPREYLSDAKNIVEKWIECLQKKDLTQLPNYTKMEFPVDVTNRCEQNDIDLMCEMILNKPL